MFDYWTDKTDKSLWVKFFHFSDDDDLVRLRYNNWKVVFMEQQRSGTCQIQPEPFIKLRVPKIFNLPTDPYERADITFNSCWNWMFDHIVLLVPDQTCVAQFRASFRAFPLRRKPASFAVEAVIEPMGQAASGET